MADAEAGAGEAALLDASFRPSLRHALYTHGGRGHGDSGARMGEWSQRGREGGQAERHQG